MKYYALVKSISRNLTQIESYDIDVDMIENSVAHVLNECVKYEDHWRRTEPYKLNHTGGFVAVSYTTGLNGYEYKVVERECDEFLTEYAIDKAAIRNENDRMSSLLMNARSQSSLMAIQEYKLLNRLFQS
jgi:hypothetical protein